MLNHLLPRALIHFDGIEGQFVQQFGGRPDLVSHRLRVRSLGPKTGKERLLQGKNEDGGLRGREPLGGTRPTELGKKIANRGPLAGPDIGAGTSRQRVGERGEKILAVGTYPGLGYPVAARGQEIRLEPNPFSQQVILVAGHDIRQTSLSHGISRLNYAERISRSSFHPEAEDMHIIILAPVSWAILLPKRTRARGSTSVVSPSTSSRQWLSE